MGWELRKETWIRLYESAAVKALGQLKDAGGVRNAPHTQVKMEQESQLYYGETLKQNKLSNWMVKRYFLNYKKFNQGQIGEKYLYPDLTSLLLSLYQNFVLVPKFFKISSFALDY